MGMIRQGDPYGFPDIDVMERRGLVLHLDTVWRHENEARAREKQLEQQGKTVYVLSRYAAPEEVKNHQPTKLILPSYNEAPVHLDGRYTKVWDVWVVVARKHRKKKLMKSKAKRKPIKKSLKKAIKKLFELPKFRI